MTTIGAGWYKVSEKGTEFISISVDKELLPLKLTDKQILTLFTIKEEDRKQDNSPHYRLSLSLKE